MAEPARVLLIGTSSAPPGRWAAHLRAAGFDPCPADGLEDAAVALAGGGPAVDLLLVTAPWSATEAAVWPDARHLIGSGLPLVLCAASSTPAQRAGALDNGADEVLDEAMPAIERLARLRRLVRRARHALPSPRREADRVGPWRFDRLRRTLQHDDGRQQVLTEAEARLLNALMLRPNEVMSREQLLQLSGDGLADLFDRSIDSRISRLRRKLEPGPGQPELLRTVWGRGYRLLPDTAG